MIEYCDDRDCRRAKAAVLIDFGLSRPTWDDASEVGITKKNLAPELKSGHSVPTTQTDVFGLGATFIELIEMRSKHYPKPESERLLRWMVDGDVFMSDTSTPPIARFEEMVGNRRLCQANRQLRPSASEVLEFVTRCSKYDKRDSNLVCRCR